MQKTLSFFGKERFQLSDSHFKITLSHDEEVFPSNTVLVYFGKSACHESESERYTILNTYPGIFAQDHLSNIIYPFK